jgi:hypothetical protein
MQLEVRKRRSDAVADGPTYCVVAVYDKRNRVAHVSRVHGSSVWRNPRRKLDRRSSVTEI